MSLEIGNSLHIHPPFAGQILPMAGVGGGAVDGNNQGGFHRRSINRIAARASLLQTFSSVHDGFQSLQGKLLLDGGSLSGSFFNRTVVLICQHSSDGAFGLVLNRGAERTVGEAITEDLPERIGEQDLWVGGPVQPASLSYLHSDDYLPDANVFPNLNLDHSLEDLVELGGSFSNTQKVRVFTGYSGRSEEHTSELQSRTNLVCRLLLEKKKN